MPTSIRAQVVSFLRAEERQDLLSKAPTEIKENSYALFSEWDNGIVRRAHERL